jgi:hypothetical protein
MHTEQCYFLQPELVCTLTLNSVSVTVAVVLSVKLTVLVLAWHY